MPSSAREGRRSNGQFVLTAQQARWPAVSAIQADAVDGSFVANQSALSMPRRVVIAGPVGNANTTFSQRVLDRQAIGSLSLIPRLTRIDERVVECRLPWEAAQELERVASIKFLREILRTERE